MNLKTEREQMGRRRHDYNDFPPYIPVAQRKKEAEQIAAKLKKKGHKLNPIEIEGRSIAKTFWGKSWCKNLELYSDYANRLPRGRSYLRHGSVIDLVINSGKVTGVVAGSDVYKIEIIIANVAAAKWKKVVDECSGEIDSLIELLQGKFSKSVMEIITQPKKGLFPHPDEIKFECSCPDYASMCKHVAAVLYGVGARLDAQPEDLFLLRKVDHTELFDSSAVTDIAQSKEGQKVPEIDGDLSDLFGIDLADSSASIEPSDVKEKVTKKKKVARPKESVM